MTFLSGSAVARQPSIDLQTSDGKHFAAQTGAAASRAISRDHQKILKQAASETPVHPSWGPHTIHQRQEHRRGAAQPVQAGVSLLVRAGNGRQQTTLVRQMMSTKNDRLFRAIQWSCLAPSVSFLPPACRSLLGSLLSVVCLGQTSPVCQVGCCSLA